MVDNNKITNILCIPASEYQRMVQILREHLFKNTQMPHVINLQSYTQLKDD